MKILYYVGWALTRLVSKAAFRIKVTGRQHFPSTGGFIVATNHLSYFDPPLVGSWASRQVYFLAKEQLFRHRPVGAVLRRINAIPVRRAAVDRKALAECIETIESGYGLVIFPEGTRSKTDGFLDPKPGIGLIVSQAKCPVVPGYIHCSHKLGACFLGREKLGISFGRPFPAEWAASFPTDKQGYLEMAGAVMERIGELREEVLALKQEGCLSDKLSGGKSAEKT